MNSKTLIRLLADKVSGFFKLFQARSSGTIFYSHGEISCWRRELLGQEILYHHDTDFHGIEKLKDPLDSHKSGAGTDMVMGLLLHRLSEKKKKRMMIDVTELSTRRLG